MKFLNIGVNSSSIKVIKVNSETCSYFIIQMMNIFEDSKYSDLKKKQQPQIGGPILL